MPKLKNSPTPHALNRLEESDAVEMHSAEFFQEMMQRIHAMITPVWPLKDYVAVNPYAGIAHRKFLEARAFLRSFAPCETLMPLDYYANLFQREQITRADIDAAYEEMVQVGFDPLPSEIVVQSLANRCDPGSQEDSEPQGLSRNRIRSIAEFIDEQSETNWHSKVVNEVSKHCAAHFDQGQAAWHSPWSDLPLYSAWQQAAKHDRQIELAGLRGFRKFAGSLPHTPDAAIATLLEALDVPESMWESVLLCQAYSIPGWSAWARYATQQSSDAGLERDELAGLLAMKLAYDVALSRMTGVRIDWSSFAQSIPASSAWEDDQDEVRIRFQLLRASEIHFRKGLVASIASKQLDSQRTVDVRRKLAQMVFCIDVRSERMRRHLETVSNEVQTFGFAGFFGMPFEYIELGSNTKGIGCGDCQVPVLLKPQFLLHEGLNDTNLELEQEITRQRGLIRLWRKCWKAFQESAISCFSFVESIGPLYATKLLARTLLTAGATEDGRLDGFDGRLQGNLGPTLRGLTQQGLTTSRQVDLVESMLRGIGLTKNFARLVVLCGHGSKAENNPLQASLDCGACGGHSGEPNARLAALLLNQEYVRQALKDRGWEIPNDTYFVPALHNTTTDEIHFFDLDDAPASHRDDIEELKELTTAASQLTATERSSKLTRISANTPAVEDVLRRARDWSEVRPEWGLAGNAAFIAAPRELTRGVNLEGRVFLHTYDHTADANGAILETIMTAPLVVANWINMQYYASVVDGDHFGSGNKTIHNVVGRFGILSGSTGDLMTGLPWQSLHNGSDFQHAPLRLQAIIAAPRAAIQRVIDKHALVSNLIVNGWIHLIAIEENTHYRYTENAQWQPLEPALTDAA